MATGDIFESLAKLCEYTVADHVSDVKEFMIGAKQAVGFAPRVPSTEERLLRAKLIYEECMETIEALGVDHILGRFIDAGEENYDPVKVLDGVCDIAVVADGTLVACGLDSVYPEALERVNNNNLTKVGPKARWREDGKLLKPGDYKPVELNDLIEKATNGNRD